MTDIVHVPYGDDRAETATLLLAAAEETKQDAGVVTIDHYSNSFRVPADVAKQAGLDTFDPDAEFKAAVEAARKTADDPNVLNVNAAEIEGEKFADPGPTAQEAQASEAPAKKTAAKRPAAKKTAAKKTAAKKS